MRPKTHLGPLLAFFYLLLSSDNPNNSNLQMISIKSDDYAATVSFLQQNPKLYGTVKVSLANLKTI